MKHWIAGIVSLLMFTSFGHGVAVADIEVNSYSGRTLFKAEIEDMMIFTSGSFQIDGKQIIYPKYQVELKVQFIPEKKQLVLRLFNVHDAQGKPVFTLKVLPSSFRQVLRERGSGTEFHDQYRFDAVVSGTDPRYSDGRISPDIFVSGMLDYQL